MRVIVDFCLGFKRQRLAGTCAGCSEMAVVLGKDSVGLGLALVDADLVGSSS